MIKDIFKKGVWFVSGIDTDAGKSYATGALAKKIAKNGTSVITQKFIQTGGTAENGISEDINIHRSIMGCGILDIDKEGTTASQIFSYPASPHLAAEIDSVDVDLKKISESTKILSQMYDVVLVEGAGGLLVPIKRFYTTADYIKDKAFPLVFVTSGKLGSINHTLLSLEACRIRGIKVDLIMYNRFFGTDKIIDDSTMKYFLEYIKEYHPGCELLEFLV